MVGIGNVVLSQGRNIVITSDGIAIATSSQADRQLVTYDVRTSQERTHRFTNLPSNVNAFHDVSVDPRLNSRIAPTTFVFAIDAEAGIVCSFNLCASNNRRQQRNNNIRQGGTVGQDVQMNLIGCTTRSVSTQPFTGIANMGGTMVVSGGTGGTSVFTYNPQNGRLSSEPFIRNQRLRDVGNPDVTMISNDRVAYCADDSRGSISFGVVTASINRQTSSITRDSFSRVQGTVGFDYSLGPANFPFESSVYRVPGEAQSYLYAANGAVTVQDTSRGSSTRDVNLPSGFEALTIDVDSQRGVAVVGGVVDDGASSAYLVLDIRTRPLSPSLIRFQVIGRNANQFGRVGSRRITGIVHQKEVCCM